jgi:GntR family transcriptional regulator, trigonelline degradation regulator
MDFGIPVLRDYHSTRLVCLGMTINRVNSPIRDQAVKDLRSAIIRSEFKPGERLFEKKLCEFVGVSRTTIREALRHLESEGLVKVIPQKGPIVATVTVDEANDIYEVREVLEGLACRLFAKRASAHAISALRRSLELLDKYVRENRLNDQILESINFYRIILEGSKNEVLYALINSFRNRISSLRATSLSEPNRPLQSFKELKQIYEAIEKRDQDAAWEASIHHIREAKSIALQILSSSGGSTPVSDGNISST